MQDSVIAARFTSPTFAIWGSSATDVYSGNSTLIHFDGQRWNNTSPTTISGNPIIWGIWGDSPTDVWVLTSSDGDNVHQYNGSQWLVQNMPPFMPGSHPVYCPTGWLIAALSSTNVFMFDQCGALNTFDGTSWHVYTYGVSSAWSALWAVPGNAIYAIRGGGSIPRGVYVASSPTTWTLVPGSPSIPQTNLAPGWIGTMNGLWGDAANDLFAAVADTIYHYDGTTWTAQGDPSWHGWAMYGPSLTDIFVVGPKGFILHGRR